MESSFDSRKNAINIAKHGVSFDDVALFEWDTASGNRSDYGENRFISYGIMKQRLHTLVWTPRDGYVRPISLRKANSRERKFYEKIK